LRSQEPATTTDNMRSTMLIMLIWSININGEVKIREIPDNPGLIPTKIGRATNIVDYWKIIHILDFTTFHTQYNYLLLSVKRLKFSLWNTTIFRDEYLNYEHLLEEIKISVRTKWNKIFPDRIRRKRGLINGLGMLIKTITGNLDEKDAQHFNEAIDILKNSQQQLEDITKQQIIISTKAIQKFNTTAQKLVQNQQVLQQRLIQLENNLKNDTQEQTNNLLLFTICNQMLFSFNIILRTLESAEEAIVFSQIGKLHPSIIESESLFQELKSIEPFLRDNKFPAELTLKNIPTIESSVRIKSYFRNMQIVFILEIPLIENALYSLYHLYTFPINIQAHLFQIIIPSSKFLLQNEQKYALTNQPCHELTKNNFLCENPHIERITETSPCEIQLVKFTNKYDQCHQRVVKLEERKIQKINENQWIAIFPNRTILQEECHQEVRRRDLHGSYIITMDQDCKIQVGQTTLAASKPLKENLSIMKMPPLKLKVATEILHQLKPINLEQINLDELKPLEVTLHQLEEAISKPKDSAVHFHTISGYTLILYIFISFVLGLIIYRYVKFQSQPSQVNKVHNVPLEEIGFLGTNPPISG